MHRTTQSLTFKVCTALSTGAFSHGCPALAAVARTFAIERGSDIPNPKEPFVEEDAQGTISGIKENYERTLAQHSGTAEDVRNTDTQKGSLNKMAIDSTDVEKDYKAEARDSVGKGPMERFQEDPEVADIVMGSEKSADFEMADKGISGAGRDTAERR